VSSAADALQPPADQTSANIRTVIDLERGTLTGRTPVELLTDRVTAMAGSTGFVAVHVIGFAAWMGLNAVLPRPFDPYPFSLLTLAVSLEAIVLTGFVLMAQNRMTQAADKRAHLDLQVNLLAEQELTAILKVVCLIAETGGIDVSGCDPRLDQLLGRTDVKGLADELGRELAAADAAPATATASTPRVSSLAG